MKQHQQFYILITLLTLIFSSCGGNKKERTNNSIPEENKNTQVSKKEERLIIYSRNGDCDSFIKAIDFSSLCFTEKQHPEYEKHNQSKGIRCQFQLSDEKIIITIIHKDYTNFDAEKIEMDQLLSKGVLEKSIKNKRAYTNAKKIDNLGDIAYIGYNKNGENENKLGIVLNNVTVSIEVNGASCSATDNELIKMGHLIIEQIKK